ncbi:MAG: SpoIIE family protein phosphatase [Tepidisphaeraceae bacterium]
MGAETDANEANRELSFRAKLLLSVCALVLCTGAAITLLAVRSFRASATQLATTLFREVSQHAVTRARGFVLRAVPVVSSLKELAGDGLAIDDSDHLARQFVAVLGANPDLTWVSYGDEAGAFTGAYRTQDGVLRVNQSRIEGGKTRLVEHDVQPDGSWKLHRKDDDTGYDPRTRPFYLKAKEAKRLVWLPPYVFYEQGVPGITCADPVYDAAGALRGVLTVDFELNALSDFVAGLNVSPGSKTFVFTSDGLLLAHPNRRLIAQSGGRADGELPKLRDVDDPLAAAFAGRVASMPVPEAHKQRFEQFRITQGGVDYLASTTSFGMDRDLAWVVGVVAPESDFLAAVWRSERVAMAISLVALLLASVVAIGLAQRVSRPITSLIGFMRRVGEGNLDTRADIRGSREFRELSAELNTMIGLLRDRMALRHSLGVAMDVQQRLLPAKPPSIPGLDIAGHSTYCDETGGDYYDYLSVDEVGQRGVLIALGDVMGHGIAAALIMAGARAILRSRARGEGNLARLVTHLNDLLVNDLQGRRFMTMHLSIIDLDNMVFRWASAGHDPALIYDPVKDRFEEIDVGGLPLGVADGAEYQEAQYQPLHAGQVILIGSDGVWETANPAGELFEKDRLRDIVRQTASLSSAEIINAIIRRLDDFRGRKNPADDVTLVVLKVLGDPSRFAKQLGEDAGQRIEIE